MMQIRLGAAPSSRLTGSNTFVLSGELFHEGYGSGKNIILTAVGQANDALYISVENGTDIS